MRRAAEAFEVNQEPVLQDASLLADWTKTDSELFEELQARHKWDSSVAEYRALSPVTHS